MCAQRKAGRRQRARRLADLVFKMAARAMADEYAVFKISSALFILRILSKSWPIHVVCMKRKLFSPHTLDSSIIMFTTELHNVYYRTLNRKTTSRGRDGTQGEGGALGYFLGGYVPPGTPNWQPVLEKIPPKIDTPF